MLINFGVFHILNKRKFVAQAYTPSMSDFSWSEFLAGGSIVKIIDIAAKYYLKKKEVKVDVAQNIRDIEAVHHIMEKVVAETFFNRFIIFVGEDSAGILAAGKNLYITAQYEKIAHDEGLDPIIDLIQRWKADTCYYGMFSKVLSDGQLLLKTSEMDECKLKDIYQMQNIKLSKVFHLMTTKDSAKVFYCSIASTVKETITVEDKVVIDSSIDKLREIFGRHRKFYS
jgi:hypothetical protein